MFQFVNFSEVEISGVEARADFALDDSWSFTGSIAAAKGDMENDLGDGALPSIDPVKFAGGIRYRAPSGRFGGEATITIAGKKDEDRLGVACTPPAAACFAPPSFGVIDLTGFWNITDNVALRGGVFNLTDEKYWWWSDVRGRPNSALDNDAYTMPGRNVGISLTLKL